MSLMKAGLALLQSVASKNPKARRYDDQGRYYPDPTPIAPPVGYVRSPTIAEQIRTMVRSESLKHHAESQGMDTFEEADDFNVGDDYDPRSPWEEQFDGEFDAPLTNQEPAPRDPEDRNPPTPPPAQNASADTGGAAAGLPKEAPASPATPLAPR